MKKFILLVVSVCLLHSSWAYSAVSIKERNKIQWKINKISIQLETYGLNVDKDAQQFIN